MDDVIVAPVAIDPLQIPNVSQGRGVHPGAVGSGGRQLPLQRGPVEKWYSQGGPDDKDADWGGIRVEDPDQDGTYLVLIGGKETGQLTDSILQYKLHYKFNGQWLADQDNVGSFQNGTTTVWSVIGTIRPEDVGFEGGQDWFNSCDIDGDGINNSVDGDIDGDGLVNSQDNDKDGDGIPNEEDDFPEGNPVCGGNDMDGDGVDDCNDVDIDNDGIPNSEDDDDDGDGIPDVDDPTPKGSDCEEEPTPADPPAWWEPPPNVIESESVIVFPPGDIDGDGIPNELDDDADGDGIPNYADPDADGDGTPDAEQTPRPWWTDPVIPSPTPPPIIIQPPIIQPPPYYEPPIYEPPTDPTAECDPCYYLAQIAEMLSYDPYRNPDTGEIEEPEYLHPEFEVLPRPEPPIPRLEFEWPDITGGTPRTYYIPIQGPGFNTQFKIGWDLDEMAGFYPEASGMISAVSDFRNLLRLFLLCVAIYTFVSYVWALFVRA